MGLLIPLQHWSELLGIKGKNPFQKTAGGIFTPLGGKLRA
jgi:hypothetical protein